MNLVALHRSLIPAVQHAIDGHALDFDIQALFELQAAHRGFVSVELDAEDRPSWIGYAMLKPTQRGDDPTTAVLGLSAGFDGACHRSAFTGFFRRMRKAGVEYLIASPNRIELDGFDTGWTVLPGAYGFGYELNGVWHVFDQLLTTAPGDFVAYRKLGGRTREFIRYLAPKDAPDAGAVRSERVDMAVGMKNFGLISGGDVFGLASRF